MAMGDSGNDIAMLRQADLVLPGQLRAMSCNSSNLEIMPQELR